MAKSTSQKVKVGIFIVTGTILLIIGLYFIGARQHMFSKNIKLYAVFDNVKGLQTGNNVRYSGINVGTVEKIEMKEEGVIIVEMSVEEKTANFIKKNAVASITSDGLVGSMVMNISPGNQQENTVVISGDTIKSQMTVDTDDMLSTLNTTNENVSLMTTKLLRIINDILDGKGTLGTLISDTLISSDISKSMAELKKTTEGASRAVSNVNEIISKIQYDKSAAAVLLSDPASAGQIRKVFTNLEQSSDEIIQVSKNLNEYLEEIKSGEGVLNQLTQDKVLANDLDTTMTNIKEAAEKLNQNMEALKHNFLFRGYFKKLDRQEKKEAKENE